MSGGCDSYLPLLKDCHYIYKQTITLICDHEALCVYSVCVAYVQGCDFIEPTDYHTRRKIFISNFLPSFITLLSPSK